MAIVKSFGVTAALHRTQTHSGCQTLVVRSTVKAHSICRVGSSRQDVSSSGWSGLMRARRGQQMRIGCSGAGGLGVRVSGVVRVFVELGLFAGVVPICVGPLVSIVVCMWGTLDGFGGPTSCMAQRRCIRWLQAGQLYGAFGPMPSRWMSCKQIAHVVGCAAAAVVAAGGVVAPCVVQCGGVGQVDLGGCLGPYDKEADDRDWAGGNKHRGGSPTSCLWRAF